MAKKFEIPPYGSLYFDHLQGEYLLVANSLTDEEKEQCLAIQEKRNNKTLSWKDIYSYELILLKRYDVETLKSKIISLRIKYQSLVDIAEYNSYDALRAVDLNKPVGDEDKEKMRADYKYMLDEFYLRYAYVSAREDFRTRLLHWGAGLMVIFIVLCAGFMVSAFYLEEQTIISTFSVLIAVMLNGIMGAFVSVQQRLQSISGKGDPIYNLSLLTHGWFSIFLSPISGAIFAIVLYLFFTSGLLSGPAFPVMERQTKAAICKEQTPQNPAPPTGDSVQRLGFRNFIEQTGPQSGKDFALLLVWSFIAGFAERFVPDTLMRLVNQRKSGETAPA